MGLWIPPRFGKCGLSGHEGRQQYWRAGQVPSPNKIPEERSTSATRGSHPSQSRNKWNTVDQVILSFEDKTEQLKFQKKASHQENLCQEMLSLSEFPHHNSTWTDDNLPILLKNAGENLKDTKCIIQFCCKNFFHLTIVRSCNLGFKTLKPVLLLFCFFTLY